MTEISPAVPATKPKPLSPAERMRLSRSRRRKGLRFLTVELRETEIDGLIRRKRLAPADRNSPAAIRKALYAFFESCLV
jgi:hypothetical protein